MNVREHSRNCHSSICVRNTIDFIILSIYFILFIMIVKEVIDLIIALNCKESYENLLIWEK
jgi:hypothetical protein